MRMLVVVIGLLAGTAVAQTVVTDSTIDVDSPPRFLSFAADSQGFITAGPAGLESWDLETGERIQFEVGRLGELDTLGDASMVLRGGNLSTGEVLYELPEGLGVTWAPNAAFSRDGSVVARSVPGTRRLSVWDAESGDLRFATDSGLGFPMDLEFSPDGTLLAGTYQDANIYVWSVSDGRLLHVIDELDLSSFTMEFSPDGAQLITGGADQILRVWDTRTWNIVRQFETRHPEAIRDLHLSIDGRFLLTSGLDVASEMNPAHLVLWDVASGTELARIRLSRAPASVALSPDGRMIAAVDSGETQVRLWTLGD